MVMMATRHVVGAIIGMIAVFVTVMLRHCLMMIVIGMVIIGMALFDREASEQDVMMLGGRAGRMLQLLDASRRRGKREHQRQPHA